MPVTAAHISRFRRLISEPTTDIYTDDDLTTYLERQPILDGDGEESDYDLHAAAYFIWLEKAAGVAAKFDFDADGGDYKLSQQFEHYQTLAEWHKKQAVTSLVPADAEPMMRKSYLGSETPPDDPYGGLRFLDRTGYA